MAESPYQYTFDPEGETTAARVIRAVGREKYVLELGCAYGVMTKVFTEQMGCRVFGIENDPESAKYAQGFCESLEVLDLEDAKLETVLGDRRFDVIVAADVLEHLRDPLKVLKSLKRFLSSEGYIVLSLPNVSYNGVVAELLNEDFQYRKTGLLDSTHLRFWAARGIKRLLAEASLATTKVESSRLPTEESEFAASWKTLPEWMKTALRGRADGDVYQYVITALPAEKVIAADLVSWPITSELPPFEEFDRKIAEAEIAVLKLEEAGDLAARKNAELNDLMDEMKQTLSWRLTRPFRFLGRLSTKGFATEDRRIMVKALRDRYHRLPIPPVLKKGVSVLAHRFVGRIIGRVRRKLRSFRKFRPPNLRPAAQQNEAPDYFVWGIINWHFRHQRPQQISLALGESGRRVFYISPSFRNDERAGFEVEQLDSAGRVFQITLYSKVTTEIYSTAPDAQAIARLCSSVGEVLNWSDSRQIVSLVHHPFWTSIASALPNSRLVYDCMDHHEGFGNIGESVINLEKELFAKADLTVTTSAWLDREVASRAPHRALIRNAGDFNHFTQVPANIYRDPQGRRIIGYYGAIAEWFDVELLEATAKKFSDCSILLIGADTIRAKGRLRKYSNIKFVGEVPYADLPHYLHAFDVCLLPFKVVPLTLATNPVKAYEYLSAGKPIVSLDLPEMSQFEDLVYVARDRAKFLDFIGQIFSQPEPPSLIERRKRFAEGETWIQRAKTLIQHAESPERDPKVSVVVVTYNNLDLTKACLKSLDDNSDYSNFEIIVVDNASSDGSQDFLKTWAAEGSNRKIILNADNRGFAAGNNQGLVAATGDYLVMLNNDTFVTPGWIRTLMAHFKRDPSIGLVGPVTGNIGNEAKIDIHYNNMDEMVREAAIYTRSHMGQTYPLRTAAFFCVMLKREVFEAVGPLDEAFGRGFFEDDDYCRRVEQRGLHIVCADDVFVHHHLSASFNKLKQQDRQRLFDENKKIYEAKWGPWIPHEFRSTSTVPASAQTIETPKPFIGFKHFNGECNVCGKHTRFYFQEVALWRESLTCGSCRTTSRYRSISRGLLKAIHQLTGIESKSLAELPKRSKRALHVYDTQRPFYYNECSYPLPDLLKATKWISVALSQFKPDLSLGTKLAPGVTNQNLETLTFANESCDIVVTSDVMEHVRLDDLAHREIYRVLKPGGVYIFTVPNMPDREQTLVRVQVTDPADASKDVHLLEPEYHGDTNNDTGEGVLAYRTYGVELQTKLKKLGFEVEYTRAEVKVNGILNTELYYCRKPVRTSPDHA